MMMMVMCAENRDPEDIAQAPESHWAASRVVLCKEAD